MSQLQATAAKLSNWVTTKPDNSGPHATYGYTTYAVNFETVSTDPEEVKSEIKVALNEKSRETHGYVGYSILAIDFENKTCEIRSKCCYN